MKCSEILDTVTNIGISSDGIPDHNHSDIAGLVELYDLANQARNAFLSGQISFDDYIMLLEIADIEIDDYLQTVEQNLTTLQLSF